MSDLSKRQLLALAAALAATPAMAQTETSPAMQPNTADKPPSPANAPPAAPGVGPVAGGPKPEESHGRTEHVRLTTPLGPILVEIYVEAAPITGRNFMRYVNSRRYDGASFYRATKPKGVTGNDFGVVQGGVNNNPAKQFPPIPHESTAKTGIKHLNGTLSMGRRAPGTAQSEFFICVGDQPFFDAKKGDPGYAAFGRVLEGMEIVKKILGMPTSPTAGVGVMKGTMLKKPVPIITARKV